MADNALSWVKTQDVVPNATDSSSTTTRPTGSVAIEAPVTSDSCVNYADIGITYIMPTTGLCRVGVVRVALMRGWYGFDAMEEHFYAA